MGIHALGRHLKSLRAIEVARGPVLLIDLQPQGRQLLFGVLEQGLAQPLPLPRKLRSLTRALLDLSAALADDFDALLASPGTAGQLAPSGTASADYAQRSQVFSVDTVWDAWTSLSLGAKYGLRIGELRANKTSGEWFSSRADLLVLRAHAAARDAIKAICPEVKVGLTLSLHDLQAQPGGEAFAEAAWQEEFTHYLPYIKKDDFLGVQNYTRTLYGPQGQLPAPEGAELTQMDYEVYPQALEHVIRKVAEEFKGDLIVTENGIATADDTRRVAFIRQALDGVQHCIADGIPVKGYFHWSLMDNFEWQKGYAMQFGLIAVNRETMERTAKPSLGVLGSYTER